MEVRAATPDDQEAVMEIAERSLEASYTLSPQTIEGTVHQWYDEAEYTEKVDREDMLFLLAEHEGEAVAFTETVIHDDETGADLLWLHVHPDYRGEGIGSDLFDAVRDRLHDRGITQLRGRVLSMNEVGNTFYKQRGFEKVGEGEVEIDGSPYTEALYLEAEPEGLEPRTTDDGQTVYIDHDDVDEGSAGPFHVVYVDEAREEKYGYHCGKCDSLANAMDAMGRIECGECGNSRKPTRWDAAYM
jgi:ribosomal protein S18 acetylase RimI-like enzyme